MNVQTISCKRQFQALWQQGLLGNKTRTWDTLAAFRRSGFTGKVALRYQGRGFGGPFITDLSSVAEVKSQLKRLALFGWLAREMQIIEQLSPESFRYVITGEVMRTDRYGLALFFSLENAMMRPALRSSGKQVFGLSAQIILQQKLWHLDYEELMGLVDQYPDHVVEFSGFDRCVGITPRRRMIIWEVRSY